MADEAFKTKNVVLVHGAFADGSSWSGVVELLQSAGLHVAAVQNPLTSLKDDVEATKRALAMQDGPTVLVGHSYGGTVISEVGVDPKVTGLVYVAALAPEPGEDVGQTGLQCSSPRRLRVHRSALPMALRNSMKQDLSRTSHRTFRPLGRGCSRPHKARLSKPFSITKQRSLRGNKSRAGTPFRLRTVSSIQIWNASSPSE